MNTTFSICQSVSKEDWDKMKLNELALDELGSLALDEMGSLGLMTGKSGINELGKSGISKTGSTPWCSKGFFSRRDHFQRSLS